MKHSRLALVGAALLLVLSCRPATADVPDQSMSYYVPQTGPVGTPTEGTSATQLFRTCPNLDGASFPSNARIKVVARDTNGNGIAGIAAADICILFNRGTVVQGFSGVGADSIIANSTWNTSPACPDVQCLSADVATNANGETYITFIGAIPSNPGVNARDPNRKWGHYDSELPVYVLGHKISGRLTTASANGTYTLRIKNFDWTGGLGTTMNAGEAVSITDLNGIVNGIGVSNAVSYWRDFDSNGAVNSTDLNLITAHSNHNCGNPNNP